MMHQPIYEDNELMGRPDYRRVPDAIDWMLKYARDARWNIVTEAVVKLEKYFKERKANGQL